MDKKYYQQMQARLGGDQELNPMADEVDAYLKALDQSRDLTSQMLPESKRPNFEINKQSELKGLPQSDIQDVISQTRDKDRQDYENMFEMATMSGGIKLNPLQREARDLMLKEGIEGLKNRVNRIQEDMKINEHGISSLPEEAFNKMEATKKYFQDRIADYTGAGVKDAPQYVDPSSDITKQIQELLKRTK